MLKAGDVVMRKDDDSTLMWVGIVKEDSDRDYAEIVQLIVSERNGQFQFYGLDTGHISPSEWTLLASKVEAERFPANTLPTPE